MCLIHFYKRDKDTSKLCQGCLLQATLGLDILNRPAINLHIPIILNSLHTVIILSSLLMATILKCLSSMLQERLPRIHHKLEQSEVLPPTHHNSPSHPSQIPPSIRSSPSHPSQLPISVQQNP